nr:hypothetical protein [Tanacetum cinerariifolium]
MSGKVVMAPKFSEEIDKRRSPSSKQEDESHNSEYSTFNFFRKLKAHEPTYCIELGLCLLSISSENSGTITTLRDTVPP